MSDEELATWAAHFSVPTAGELDGSEPVDDPPPGFATLCHGERVVAEGELVSVEGRLGLQITRMASQA